LSTSVVASFHGEAVFCLVSILSGKDLVDDSLWSVYGVVSHLHLVRSWLAQVFTDCVCTNFSVNLIIGENYTALMIFYSSPSIFWVIEVDRSCGIYGDRGGVYTGFCL